MPFLSSFLINFNLVIQSRSKIPFLRLPCDLKIMSLLISSSDNKFNW